MNNNNIHNNYNNGNDKYRYHHYDFKNLDEGNNVKKEEGEKVKKGMKEKGGKQKRGTCFNRSLPFSSRANPQRRRRNLPK